jgi:hypothetical protein
MPRTLVGGSSRFVSAVGTTYFATFGQANIASSATSESNAQATASIAGVFSLLSFQASSNTYSTAGITVTFRKNGVNGNLTTSCGAGVTGIFTDTSHSDSTAVGDLISASFVVAAGGTGTATHFFVTSNFAAQKNHSMLFIGCSPPGLTISTASTTFFQTFANGSIAVGTAEADIKLKSTVAGSLTGFETVVSSNARTSTTTWNDRINGANGSQTLSVGSGVTGRFQDTTNTTTVAAGDLFNYAITTGTGAGNLNFRFFGTTFTATATNKNNFHVVLGAGIARAASATPDFYTALGSFTNSGSTTESTKQVPMGYPTTISNFMVYLTANTYTVAGTGNIRKNAANGNGTVSLTALTSGLFEDVTNSDVFAPTDTLDYLIVGGTTASATYTWMGVLNAPTVTPRTIVMSSF